MTTTTITQITKDNAVPLVIQYIFGFFDKFPPFIAVLLIFILTVITLGAVWFFFTFIYDKAFKKDATIKDLIKKVEDFNVNFASKILSLEESHILTKEVLKQFLQYSEHMMGSVSLNNYNHLISVLLKVFFIDVKRIVYDLLDDEKAVENDILLAKNEIGLSFERVIINTSKDFVLKDNEYLKLIQDNAIPILEDMLKKIEDMILKKWRPNIKEKKVKNEFNHFFDGVFKNMFQKELVDLYTELISNDTNVIYLKGTKQ